MVGILTASLLTFVISPKEVGAYNLVLTIVSFGALVGALGLPKTVVRLVAENVGLNRSGRARRVIYTVLGLGVVGTLLTSLAYYLVIGDIIENRLFHSPLLVGLTGLVAAWIAIAVVQEITAETFRGFHDIRWATLLGGLATGGKSGGLIMRLVLLGTLTLLVVTGAGVDLRTVTLVSIGAGLVSVLLSCWLLYGRVSSLGSKVTEEPVSTRGSGRRNPVSGHRHDRVRLAVGGHLDIRYLGLEDGGRRLRQRLQAGHLRGDAALGGQPRDAAHRR
jgi:O-antigen/teichoic acid export membrane protein